MSAQTLILFVLTLILVVIIARHTKVIREDQRAVIFRLGRFISIAGPGVLYLIPVIDKALIVNLPEDIPGWQGLSKEELDERVKSLVLSRF